MASGGARTRSGPPKDPNSRTSERAGYTPTALPGAGYAGRAPAFPLPRIDRFVLEFTEGGGKARVPSKTATAAFRKRELEVWREQWKSPQACMWAEETWRWPTVAELCRLKTVIELEPDANAALVGQLYRLREDCGLTTSGLKANGWTIARNELAAKRQQQKAGDEPPQGDEVGQRRRRRLRDAQ